MTEFQELIKDAPGFAFIERGELVAYAYGMFADLAKMDAENAKLRELVAEMWRFGFSENSGANSAAEWNEQASAICDRMRELGVVE